MKRIWMAFKIVFLLMTITFLFGLETSWTKSSNTCAQIPKACKQGFPDGTNKDKCYCMGGSGCLLNNGESGCGHCFNPGDGEVTSDTESGPDS
jgi:hypothetical protein